MTANSLITPEQISELFNRVAFLENQLNQIPIMQQWIQELERQVLELKKAPNEIQIREKEAELDEQRKRNDAQRAIAVFNGVRK